MRSSSTWALLVWAASFSLVRGADTSDSLVGLVGDDACLCVEVAGLETAVPEILQSEFVSRLTSLQLYRDWLECEDHRKLERSRQGIEKFAGKPFDQLAYELLGRSFVVAVYPSPVGGLKGVVITRAADEATLDGLVDTWNRQASVTTETVAYAARKYVRRIRRDRKTTAVQTLYYARFGDTFALSDQESLIRRTLDLRAASLDSQGGRADQAAGRLDESELYRATQRGLSPDSLVRAYFNPQGCEAAANLFAARKGDPLQHLLAAGWRRCSAIGAGMRLDEGVVLEIHLNYDGSELPDSWKKSLADSRGRPEFLARIPRGATVAAAGRIDPRAAARLLSMSLAQLEGEKWAGARQVARGLLLGKDPLDDVLPALGRNWAFYLAPRPAAGANEFPVDALLAVELPAEDGDEPRDGGPTLRGALDNALNTGLNYTAALHNGKTTAPPAIVRTSESGSTRTRWVEGFGEFEPAFAITSDALVVSTSPEAIGGFTSVTDRTRLSESPAFRELSGKYLSDESQLLLVDLEAVRGFVRRHAELFGSEPRDAEADAGSADAPVPVYQPDSQIVDVLGLFDAAFAAVRFEEDRIRLVAGAVLLPAAREADSGSARRN